jgi:hypothetical protein
MAKAQALDERDHRRDAEDAEQAFALDLQDEINLQG